MNRAVLSLLWFVPCMAMIVLETHYNTSAAFNWWAACNILLTGFIGVLVGRYL